MILFAAFVALAILAGAAALAAARRRAPELPPAQRSPAPVVVLVPMRNEEENVEDCLASLLAQTTPLRIRVLDDCSEDSTGELARKLAAVDPRIEVVTVPQPPAGVNGKVHALAHGLEGIEAEWILGLDADARPATDTVARALAAAESNGLDAVSLAARQRAETIGEAMVTPPVYALLDALLGDWEPVARGDGGPVANGQFFLVRRAALEAAGGYAAIVREPLDDVALARRLAATGFRVGFWRAGDALEVRMYHGFAASFAGWRRNLSLIAGDRTAVLVATITVVLLPAVVALAALEIDVPLAAAVAWGCGALASAALREGTGSSPTWGLLYPLDALALSAALVAARLDRAFGWLAPWRGRRMALPR